MATSAVDGSNVPLANVFAKHAFTILLIDGEAPTSDAYKRLVGIALAAAERWGERVAAYVVTRRTERPFEVPCEVGILFDDDNEVAERYAMETERAYVIDSQGAVTLTTAPADGDAVLAHLASALD